MLKVSVIGIGSIAAKAYLPIYFKMAQVDFYFCARNVRTLDNSSCICPCSYFGSSVHY
ncbi:hypothetical protein NOM01_03535 [Sporolactobacillus sp. STSJ-5]|uniref:hypothetical protein n=1 Tax=Sporolactobacillus sp. STSJ-5 TaxID=2965076 RepID=UPI002102317A|nr:hypothetical protein [Sporolactobacillus sp. STSJ-5]MCQ2009065.1 hypothetical protein [Sporolactobacillus sp. STSJ-5]